jgi:cell division protein FtsN
MPDLNLKGEERRENPAQAPKKRIWLVSVLVSGLVIVLAVVLIKYRTGGPVAQEDDGSQVAPASTQSLDTVSQTSTDADSVAIDSIDAVLAAANQSAVRESSSVFMSDSSGYTNEMTRYRIQVSAWLSGSRAAREVRRLHRLGLDVDLVKSEPDSVGRAWNRILMGSYETLDEAKMVARAILDTLVVGYTFVREK